MGRVDTGNVTEKSFLHTAGQLGPVPEKDSAGMRVHESPKQSLMRVFLIFFSGGLKIFRQATGYHTMPSYDSLSEND